MKKSHAFAFAATIGLLGCDRGEPTGEVTQTPWGTVQSVDDCYQHSTGRSTSQTRCHVATDLFVFNDLAISSFPGGHLGKGDVIFKQEVWHEKAAQVSYCKGDRCTEQYWESGKPPSMK
jgi:hypothetical protein